jgi:mycothiol synthase
MRLRAPALDDAPAVLAVLEARDVADLGVVDYTLGDLLDEWRAGDFDLAADAVAARSSEGRIVAYAVVQRPGTRVVVHPEHERQGIGTELLRWAEEREQALGRACHRQWIVAGNARAEALLRSSGYRTVRSYWRMSRALDGVAAPEPAPLPAGVMLRPLDVERDAVGVHALDQASFAANPDYEPESLEEFRREHLQAHNLDPALSCVAEHSGRLAGVLLARRWAEESVGFIDILAVHPDRQRRGLGTALLTRSFSRFAQAGLGEAQLGVASDNPRALALYERAGMTPRFRADVYERPLTRQEHAE